MRYMLLVYEREGDWAAMSEADQKKAYGEYMTLTEDMKTNQQYVSGAPLQPVATATTVRIRDGKPLSTDGPFAETREQLGGYYLINAKDLDEAIGLARRIPAARNGSIEVRPVMEMGM
jgi:hypothetical protein